MPSQTDGSHAHPDNAIHISGLTKRYKNGVLANDSIDLTVLRGVIFGLLGPNGAGKTTPVRQITGELLPTSGSVDVLGVDVIKEPQRAKALMGVVPQEANPFDLLKTQHHLIALGRLHGLSWAQARRRCEELLEQLGLLPHRSRLANQLSGGLKRKLFVGMAMMAEPPLLVLDEPTTGLDPVSRREVWALISSVSAHGATVLITTHYMDEAEALCSEIAIVGGGHVLARGSVEEVRTICRHRFRATFENDGEARTLYGQSEQAVLVELHRLGIVEYAVSKTNLEDIYLELTQQEGLERVFA
jgi:ABC-2 type transport system ATP-binding protein